MRTLINGIANQSPVENLQLILDSITDAYNNTTHSVIGAKLVEVWIGIDSNHQKIRSVRYPKYTVGTYVLKRPIIGTNVFANRKLNYDPKIYQIIRANNNQYNIKSLFGNEVLTGLRHWMIHPISEEEALAILKNNTNVGYIRNKIMKKYKISQEEAMNRINQAKINLRELLMMMPD
jgi:hypothetical protein